MRNFIIGSAGLRPQRSCPANVSEPRREEYIVRSPPSAKVAGFSVPLNAKKISDPASPLKSPLHDSGFGQSSHAWQKNTPLSADLAKHNTPIESLAPRDDSHRQKLDGTLDPISHIPLAPTPTLPCHDCPRIDLVALVREKQKAKKFQKKKLPAPTLRKEQRRRVISRDPNQEQFRYWFSASASDTSDVGKPLASHPDFSACSSRRNARKLNNTHIHRPPALKRRSPFGYPVPRIFKSLSPFDSVSVFGDSKSHRIDGRREMNRYPFVL